MSVERIKVLKTRLKTYFLFRPLASMGNTPEMGFTFSGVHGRESILIPGQFIIKECLEELGVLGEYMTNYHQWIGKEFGARFAFSLIVFFFIFSLFSGTISN